MITTLTGANDFSLHAELDQRVATFVAEHGDLALERLDGQEVDFARITEAFTSLPFLASKKLVVLRAPSAQKKFLEAFESLFTGLPETTEVILVEPKLDKRLSYYKYLKSKTEFKEFTELDQSGLATWLASRAKEQGAVFSTADARYLVERVGTNQQMVSNELDKLILYNPKISRQTIDVLTELAPQSTIFQLLESAFAGNANQAMKLYAEQRAMKVEPPQIIAMLAWQLHVLALIKTAGDRSSDQIASDAKLSPFVVRKSQTIARSLTVQTIKTLISDLLTIDSRSKRTSIDTDEALQNYLLNLATN